MRKVTVGLYLIPILLGLELGAKFWAKQNLGGMAEVVPLPRGLSLGLISNPGISFGLFAGSPWPVTLVTAAMTIVLTTWFALAHGEGVRGYPLHSGRSHLQSHRPFDERRGDRFPVGRQHQWAALQQ